ncbi:unnamed protein product [Mycena citricolor]|uniref:Zinc finger CHCC-type domain-containing protein n=1 Tax=Mycena citricolor TaxID=2018698 RepID=A0AAD2JVR0_9AGAR|nr:unnamed protein product [Mycena citricolor]
MFRRALSNVARSVPSRAFANSAASVPTEIPTSTSTPTTLQAPNAPAIWSTNQQPRTDAMSGPRFEQTAMELQPNSLSAMQLISEVSVNMVHGRKAVCDGGGGPLGHPKIYLNLDLPGARSCGYCGLRFEQVHDHH